MGDRPKTSNEGSPPSKIRSERDQPTKSGSHSLADCLPVKAIRSDDAVLCWYKRRNGKSKNSTKTQNKSKQMKTSTMKMVSLKSNEASLELTRLGPVGTAVCHWFCQPRSTGKRIIGFAAAAAALMLLVNPVLGQSFFFSTGDPDGRMATASRPSTPDAQEIESADDFVLSQDTFIRQATFTGLLPAGSTLDNVTEVIVEIYRVFPKDSANPPDGRVPTRNNSPSDIAFDSRDSEADDVSEKLTFEVEVLADSFTAQKSVLNGIHPLPNVTTGGEGPVSGIEVRFNVTFPHAFNLPADHYFFVPQVKLDNGNFFWLSAPKPIVGPGTTPFTPDLQSWIRNEALQPDWLRIGTDIVGGAPAPTFNASFSLHGDVSHHH